MGIRERTIKLSTNISEDHSEQSLADKINVLYSAMSSLAVALKQLYDPKEITENITKIAYDVVLMFREIYGDGIDAYIQWGLYGWTLSPSIEYDFFKNTPASYEEANALMEKYMFDTEIDLIKHALEVAGANSEELNEAYNCYRFGMYKPCVLLLFGIVDNKIYGYHLLNKKDRVKLGKCFAKEYVDKKKYNEFFCQAIFVNILKAIETIFSDADNFTKEMTIINRNYISHGMSKRQISKLECYQIWCLAYSTLVLLDVVEDIYKANDETNEPEEQQ